jgi:hypothetical protein
VTIYPKSTAIEMAQTLKLAPGPVEAYYHRPLRVSGEGEGEVEMARKLCCHAFWMLNEG